MPKIHAMISTDQARRPLFIGVDVGGTSIKIGIVDDDGRTISRTQIATEEQRGPQDAVARIHAEIETELQTAGINWHDVASIGLGTPGSMDIPQGLILEPPNMPHWRDFPIRDQLASLCEKPVSFANDANAAAFGEYWIGSGRDFDSMVMFTLGTGVGGGIILDGVSLDGQHSFGSELGHVMIDQREDARLCVWGGGRGQLEAYASASAVTARAQEALDAGAVSSVTSKIAGGEELSPLMLAMEAERGDPFSETVILETAAHLAVGVVNVVHTVDPGIVIIGGAMNFGGHAWAIGRKFIGRLRDEFQKLAYGVVQETPIEYASLSSSAGYIGAAGIAREAYKRAAPIM
jgi:glucokinase